MPRRQKPDPLASIVGERIQHLRLERGLTAEKLVVAARLSSGGFVSDIEHGRALPSLETLEKLAHGLGLTIADLVISPEHSVRERLIDLSRHVPAAMLRRWIREAEDHGAGADAPPKTRRR